MKLFQIINKIEQWVFLLKNNYCWSNRKKHNFEWLNNKIIEMADKVYSYKLIMIIKSYN